MSVSDAISWVSPRRAHVLRYRLQPPGEHVLSTHYGIEAAQRVGIPASVLAEARTLSKEAEKLHRDTRVVLEQQWDMVSVVWISSGT